MGARWSILALVAIAVFVLVAVLASNLQDDRPLPSPSVPSVEVTGGSQETAPSPPGPAFTGRIEGRVTRAGKGFAARITLRLHHRFDAPESRTTETDKTGAYVLERVPPGDHRLVATAADGVSRREEVTLHAGLERLVVDLAMPEGEHTLRGRAVHASGLPFRGEVQLRPIRVAVDTSEDGRFRVPGLPARQVRLFFVVDGSFHAEGPRVAVPTAEEILVIVDQDAREIRGRVLSLETGEPIPDATVSASGHGSDSRGFRTEMTTGPEGRFVVAAPLRHDRIQNLMVDAPGYGPWRLDDFAWREEVTVRLSRSARLTVRLVSAEGGEPVPGVPVTADFGWLPDVRDSAVRLTDAAGRAVFSSIPSRTVNLWVRGAGWRLDDESLPEERRFLFLEPGESREVEIPVHRTGLILAEVLTAEGRPARGASLQYQVGRDSGVRSRFVLPNLLPGAFTVWARLGGLESPKVEGTLKAKETRHVSLRLPEGARAEVIIRDRDSGEPISGAFVQLYGRGAAKYTDAGGRASFGPFRPVRARVYVRANGYRTAETMIEPFAAGKTTRATLTLDRGMALAGRVVYPDSTPAAGGQVLWHGDRGWQSRRRSRIAADGSFELTGLPEGEIDLHATAADPSGRKYRVYRRIRTGRVDVILTLAAAEGGPRREVELFVTDPEGRPVPRAEVYVEARDFGGEDGRDRDVDVVEGTGRIPVHAGEAELMIFVSGARRPDGRPLPLGAERFGPFAATRDRIEVALSPELVITGRVVNPSGQGAPRLWIVGSTVPWPDCPAVEGFPWSVCSEPDGTFRIRGLSVGTWDLVVDPPDGFVQASPVRVAAGTRDLVIRLDRLVPAVVTVRGPAGKPVDNVEVIAQAEAGLVRSAMDDWSSPDAFGKTGPDGTVRFEDLAQTAPYRLRILPPAREGGFGAERIDAWRPVDTVVTLSPGRAIAGKIQNANGSPFDHERGEVWVWCAARGWRTLSIDEDGAFRELGFPAGRVALVFIPDDEESITFDDPPGEPGDHPWPVLWIEAGDEKVVFRPR